MHMKENHTRDPSADRPPSPLEPPWSKDKFNKPLIRPGLVAEPVQHGPDRVEAKDRDIQKQTKTERQRQKDDDRERQTETDRNRRRQTRTDRNRRRQTYNIDSLRLLLFTSLVLTFFNYCPNHRFVFV